MISLCPLRTPRNLGQKGPNFRLLLANHTIQHWGFMTSTWEVLSKSLWREIPCFLIETGSPKGIYQVSTETSFRGWQPCLRQCSSQLAFHFPFCCLFVSPLLISLGYRSSPREEMQRWGISGLLHTLGSVFTESSLAKATNVPGVMRLAQFSCSPFPWRESLWGDPSWCQAALDQGWVKLIKSFLCFSMQPSSVSELSGISTASVS